MKVLESVFGSLGNVYCIYGMEKLSDIMYD